MSASSIEIGQRYGKWTVLRPAATATRGGSWVCQCECGLLREQLRCVLLAGRSTSCKSCSQAAKMRECPTRLSHGHTRAGRKTPEYVAWKSMRQRCLDPASNSYPNYGGRGVRVCERWLDSFEAFLEDVGRRPGKGYSIDRLDSDGHYEPGNVRWATRTEQARNRRSNHRITAAGVTLTMAEWEARNGWRRGVVANRLRSGWDPARAVTAPLMAAHRPRRRS